MLVSFCTAGVPSTRARQPELLPFVLVLTPWLTPEMDPDRQFETSYRADRASMAATPDVTGLNFTLTLTMHFLADQLH